MHSKAAAMWWVETAIGTVERANAGGPGGQGRDGGSDLVVRSMVSRAIYDDGSGQRRLAGGPGGGRMR